MIVDSRLAGGVNFTGCKLGNVDTRLEAGTAAQAEHIASRQKFIYGIQHVKIDNAHQLEPAAFGQPGQ